MQKSISNSGSQQRVVLSLEGHVAGYIWRHFGFMWPGQGCYWHLLNVLQGTGQPLRTENCLAPNLNSAQIPDLKESKNYWKSHSPEVNAAGITLCDIRARAHPAGYNLDHARANSFLYHTLWHLSIWSLLINALNTILYLFNTIEFLGQYFMMCLSHGLLDESSVDLAFCVFAPVFHRYKQCHSEHRCP